jgi:hypothetical protein
MKFIRDIGLQLDYDENIYSRQYKSDFAFHCRFIGNYLRRQVKQIKFEPNGYSRLLINACRDIINPNKIFESWLCVSIPFDQVKYDSLPKEELPDFFIEMYREGILKASQTHEIPVAFLVTKLAEFKENNYLNEWEFKSKLFKEIGIRAILFCRMTMDFFSLTLILKKKDEIVLSKEILNTLPDEIIYHWQFKEIVLEENEIKVLDEFKNPIYALDITFKADK